MRMMQRFCPITFLMLLMMNPVQAEAVPQQQPGEQPSEAGETVELTAQTFSGLELRGIGPAQRSGRISDIAIDPTDRSTWYVATASSNVWKTTNRGTTWQPIFDDYGSYSTGCITLDPNNPQVVWLGTGENTSQRSVSFGDGVYRSLDGGTTWTHMGLDRSEHIGRIVIDPRDSDVVYVAAQGPLWSDGGDRGLYKTSDGGQTWERLLFISERTGVTDVRLDPRNPDVLYAASYQRRRHVGVLVGGGPESAVYKSEDGGETWKQLTRGLPGGDVGRIGLALSPQNPDVFYATIAAEGDKSGFYRSKDRGETWEKQSDYVAGDPQYYGEIYPDPHQSGRVYAVDVRLHVTDDGGRTFRPMSSEFVHVDYHAVVFDPEDPNYIMVGNDGGLYESWDQGDTWRYAANLPITQFYRVEVDDAEPFYHVYGGTQDNATLGGPSRTTNVHGIRNSDWYSLVGGDGFQARVDPSEPNIVYGESQYGGLVRFDRLSGERLDIQPQPEPGEAPLRWHWDAPLLISPHAPTRLYFAAQRLFRSDDRGNTWAPASDDLSRGIDRNEREVMGRVWSVDAVWKNVYTSPYGTIVALDESPLVEGLIYAGTDDGLIQVSENGGETWRKTERFPGVPERTYVADLMASRHDSSAVYAVFNNHKEGDFAPYVLKSIDKGHTWTSATGDLPDRHAAWTLVEDHEQPNLLFAGTEFGLFFTLDGGSRWVQLEGNLPTTQVRDLAIQRREDDLAVATFGRGFYILDDYAPLRHLTPALLAQEAHLFPVKDAWQYIEASPLGGEDKASQGHAFFTAPNPPYGAVFTYHLSAGLQSRQQVRREAERRLQQEGESVPYPSWDSLRAEEREEAPAILLMVEDASGEVIRRVEGPVTQGFHRVAWDLRYPDFRPVQEEQGWDASGPPVAPGTYTVRLAKRVDGRLLPLGEPQSFQVVPLDHSTLPTPDPDSLLAFRLQVGALQRVMLGADEVMEHAAERLRLLKHAIDGTSGTEATLYERARDLELRLMDLQVALTGDETVERQSELVPPSILDRVQRAARTWGSSTSMPTTTHQRGYEIAATAFADVEQRLGTLMSELEELEAEAEQAGVPWTSGRGVPSWENDD